MKETFEKAKYSLIKKLNDSEYLLTDDDGKLEVWVKNKNHASYGLIYKNTHLEFCRSYRPENG